MSHDSEAGFFRRRARYYDPIYSWKDYSGEARRLRELLAAEGVAGGSQLLDAACGTGSHLAHLREWYDVAGFDSSAEMIEIAREKLPGVVPLWQADMADFKIEPPDAPADALLCLFSSIAYVFPASRLRSAASCFARAVRPGGALIIEPWLDPADYTAGFRSMRTYDGEDLKLCRITCSGRKQRDGLDLSVLDFHWLALVAEESRPDHFTERHEMWLCPRKLMLDAFSEAGFDVRFDADGLMPGRGLIIGRRA